jgi:microcystin degradation protein MlrC
MAAASSPRRGPRHPQVLAADLRFRPQRQDRRFQQVPGPGEAAGATGTSWDVVVQPYFVSNTGDNPTAGGIVTWSLPRLLARLEFASPDGPRVIYVRLPGPAAVETAVRAGEGVTVTAGAKADDRHAAPLTMTGVVHAVHGDRDAQTEVVLRVGSVRGPSPGSAALPLRRRLHCAVPGPARGRPRHRQAPFTGAGAVRHGR